MKKTFILLSAFAWAASAFADFSALRVTVAITATINNPAVTTKGNIETHPAPITASLNTKTLLGLIAYAEDDGGKQSHDKHTE